jgi:hypothetical protein
VSVAVTLRLTVPPEATGLGVLEGPVVMVTVSVAVVTWTVRLRVWAAADPWRSVTVTESV